MDQMSNKERPEMTNNIDIDLASIPHPKDCHPVPDGATIPPYTPCWIVRKHGIIEWVPNGYPGEAIVGGNAALCLTAEPIVVPSDPPSPEDSLIILHETKHGNGGRGALAVWMPGEEAWVTVGESGYGIALSADDIFDWAPAIVTESGRGVWDDRDKSARVDTDGNTWYWDSVFATWECTGRNREYYGSLNAVREWCGDDYLIGFADEESDEEQERPNK